MTNEYKLSYTASDIDAKLGKVDEHEVSINTLSEQISNLESSSGGITSWNDLEDKPFYDDESVFELDGDITEKVSVQFSTNSYFVKISDETPRFELGDEIHFVYNKGNTLNFVISEDVFDPEEPYYKEGEYIIPYYFAVAYKDGVTANLGADDFVFPEAGLYVTFSTSSIDPEGAYITKLSFGEFKLLDKKFIPEGILGVKSWNDLKDRPFGELGISYSSVEDVVIAPDSTNSSIKLRNVGEVINRRPYWHENAYIEIVINGASFITLASDLPAIDSVRNATFCTYSGVNIGGKFAKDRTTGNYTITFNFSGTFDEQVTFSAYYGSIQTVQIDPKYIPEVPHTHTFNDLTDTFYEETVVTNILTWDGDAYNGTHVGHPEQLGYHKITDQVFTEEQIRPCVYTANTGYTGSCGSDLDKYGEVADKYISCDYVIIIKEPNVDYRDFHFDEAGTYVIRDTTHGTFYITLLEFEENIITITKSKHLTANDIINHSHSFNDLKDKPFVDETILIENLTFDGKTDGKKTVNLGSGVHLVKVSDYAITDPNELEGNNFYRYSNGSTGEYSATQNIQKISDTCYTASSSYMDMVVCLEDYVWAGTPLEKGVWFYYWTGQNSDGTDSFVVESYVSGLSGTYHERNFKQLDEKYIPETIVRTADLQALIARIEALEGKTS